MIIADLGIANPERELVKARLTLLIHRIIAARRLTQMQAAEILGVKQPQVSLMMRNRHGTFSVSRLIDFLTALGQDVQITVRATQKAQGELSIALFAREGLGRDPSSEGGAGNVAGSLLLSRLVKSHEKPT